jgi:hypothetical protein
MVCSNKARCRRPAYSQVFLWEPQWPATFRFASQLGHCFVLGVQLTCHSRLFDILCCGYGITTTKPGSSGFRRLTNPMLRRKTEQEGAHTCCSDSHLCFQYSVIRLDVKLTPLLSNRPQNCMEAKAPITRWRRLACLKVYLGGEIGQEPLGTGNGKDNIFSCQELNAGQAF